MDLSATGFVNGVSGDGVGGDIRPPPPEYRHPVCKHSANTGAMYGGGGRMSPPTPSPLTPFMNPVADKSTYPPQSSLDSSNLLSTMGLF